MEGDSVFVFTPQPHSDKILICRTASGSTIATSASEVRQPASLPLSSPIPSSVRKGAV